MPSTDGAPQGVSEAQLRQQAWMDDDGYWHTNSTDPAILQAVSDKNRGEGQRQANAGNPIVGGAPTVARGNTGDATVTPGDRTVGVAPREPAPTSGVPDPNSITDPTADAGQRAENAVVGDNSVDELLADMRGIANEAQVTRDPVAKARLEADAARIREQVDALLASPLSASITAEQMAAENRAQALSARGGPGATQLAQVQAQARLPQLQAQAAQAAAQEQQQRAATASSMLASAADIEGTSTTLDINYAQVNNDVSTELMRQISALGFGELQLDQKDRENLGQMIRDFAKLVQDGRIQLAQLDSNERIAIMQDMTQRYGISEQTRVALKEIASKPSFLEQVALKVVPSFGITKNV